MRIDFDARFCPRRADGNIRGESRRPRCSRWGIGAATGCLLGVPGVGYAAIAWAVRREAIRIGDVSVAPWIERHCVILEQVPIAGALSRVIRAPASVKANVLIVYAFRFHLDLVKRWRSGEGIPCLREEDVPSAGESIR